MRTEQTRLRFAPCFLLAVFTALPLSGGAATWTGAELLVPRASFPTVTPTLNGTSLVFGAGNPNEKLLAVAVLPAGFCDSASQSCEITIRLNLTRLTGDSDSLLLLSDGSQMIGAVIFDNLGGGAGIINALDLGATAQTVTNTTVLSGLGYPAIGESFEATLLFELGESTSNVTVMTLGGTATQSLTGFDRTEALSFNLVRDNEGSEQYQLNSVTILSDFSPAPGAALDKLLAAVIGVGPKSLANKIKRAQTLNEATCSRLAAFVAQVEDLSGAKIDETTARDLINDAKVIATELGCSQ